MKHILDTFLFLKHSVHNLWFDPRNKEKRLDQGHVLFHSNVPVQLYRFALFCTAGRKSLSNPLGRRVLNKVMLSGNDIYLLVQSNKTVSDNIVGVKLAILLNIDLFHISQYLFGSFHAVYWSLSWCNDIMFVTILSDQSIVCFLISFWYWLNSFGIWDGGTVDSYFLGLLAACTRSVVNLVVLPLAMDTQTQTYASNDVSLAQIRKEGGTMDLTLWIKEMWKYNHKKQSQVE